MLVLSRHKDEYIVIDLRKQGLGLVKLIVVDIRGDKVRLGIEADNTIPVHRHEVFNDMEKGTGDVPATV